MDVSLQYCFLLKYSKAIVSIINISRYLIMHVNSYIFQDGGHFSRWPPLLSAENQDSMMLTIQGNNYMDLVL